MSRICRTCLHKTASHNLLSIENDSAIRHMLALCVPELLISNVTNSVMCKLCAITVETACDFIRRCLKIEEDVLNIRKSNCSVHPLKALYDKKNVLTMKKQFKATSTKGVSASPITNQPDFEHLQRKNRSIVSEVEKGKGKAEEFQNSTNSLVDTNITNQSNQHLDLKACFVSVTRIPDYISQVLQENTLYLYDKPNCKRIKSENGSEVLADPLNSQKKIRTTNNKNLKVLPDLISLCKQKRHFSCKKCGYSTARELDFQKHSKMHYLNPHPFSCSMCSYKTELTSRLRRHVKLVHFLH